MIMGRVVTLSPYSLRASSNALCCAPFSCNFSSYHVSEQYPPSTIFMLVGLPVGSTGVKGVSLDPELSSWRRYCCCSAVVISIIIMSALILLRVSAAPPCKKPLSTVGSRPLACRHLSGSTKAGTLLLCTPMSLSPSIFLTFAIR